MVAEISPQLEKETADAAERERFTAEEWVRVLTGLDGTRAGRGSRRSHARQ
jgi:hypothetical protein